MSIRIHKTLGWGIQLSEDSLDNVVNEPSPFRNISGYPDYLEFERDRTTSRLEWTGLSSELALIRATQQQRTEEVTRHDVVHIVYKEYSDEGPILVVVPFSEVGVFHRSDDPIDHYDFDHSQNIDFPTVTYLANGIFPWNGSYVNARTHQPVPYDDLEMMRFLIALDHVEEKDMSLFSKHGFDSVVDFKENLVPAVPSVIRNLVSYLGLFKDVATVEELRPMLATYWS